MLNCDLTLLGFRLRNARKECGLTQKELAKQTGLSVKTIQDVEKGRKNPSYNTLAHLLGRLGLSPDAAFLLKNPTLSREMQWFLEYFQSCDSKHQMVLLKTIHFLAEQLSAFQDESD